MICIIPAKGFSERLKKKNMRLLNGKPLIQWTIESALRSNLFDNIVVSSEDDEILYFVSKEFDDVWIHKRDINLSTDTATVFEVCKDMLERFKADSFALLLSTSPLRTKEDIISAYNKFETSNANCLMSVTKYEHPIQWALEIQNNRLFSYSNTFIKGQGIKTKRQDLFPFYRHEGSIIMCRTEAFLKVNDWFDMKIIPFEIPRERAVDVNNQFDLDLCEFLLIRRNNESDSGRNKKLGTI